VSESLQEKTETILTGYGRNRNRNPQKVSLCTEAGYVITENFIKLLENCIKVLSTPKELGHHTTAMQFQHRQQGVGLGLKLNLRLKGKLE